jgi:DNA topoisomerase I
MSKSSLVIVESPAKANTIKKFLGKGYKVVASVGHVMDLPTNKLGVDLENGEFSPEYVVSRGKKKILDQIKKDAKSADEVFLALDLDREGEAIAWHIRDYIAPVQKNVKRIVFNEITRGAIQSAILKPTEVDMNKVDAQQARRILDRLVGYKISPILWQIFYYGLSAGRVQTVGLRLVCEREGEIEAFVAVEYWTVEGVLMTPAGAELPVKLFEKDGKKIELSNQADTDAMLKDLRKSSYQVTSVERKERRRNPQPPYITSSMQRDAGRRLRFSAKKIMMLAQQLYEGVDVGGDERVGLITYMRTDSVRVSDQAQEAARDFVAKQYGKEFRPDKPREYKTSAKAQDAHEAIRPSDVERTPESLKGLLPKDLLALYDLIWRRFMASQMESARYDTTEVLVAAGDYTLKANGRVMTFPGFLSVYEEQLDAEGGELPAVNEKDALKLKSIDGSQHFTEPPPRYTEATLIKDLEDKGIGRPSTYANIVSIIQEREYVDKQEGRLVPTTLGRQVWKTLERFFPEVFDTSFTAQMELELDKVEGGDFKWQAVVKEFYGPFKESLEHIDEKKAGLKNDLQEETDIKCDKCGRFLIKKWGRNGQFLACPAYPECKFSRPLTDQTPGVQLEGKCPKCGSQLIAKSGRYGRFAACANYPECKYTEAFPIGMNCPRPGCNGKIVEKVTKRMKVFYGCSNYKPKVEGEPQQGCDWASWDKPTPLECPSCGNPYLVHKSSKTKGDYLKCPKCKEETTGE